MPSLGSADAKVPPTRDKTSELLLFSSSATQVAAWRFAPQRGRLCPRSNMPSTFALLFVMFRQGNSLWH